MLDYVHLFYLIYQYKAFQQSPLRSARSRRSNQAEAVATVRVGGALLLRHLRGASPAAGNANMSEKVIE